VLIIHVARKERDHISDVNRKGTDYNSEVRSVQPSTIISPEYEIDLARFCDENRSIHSSSNPDLDGRRENSSYG
jgi:hypothetical protein